MNWDLVLQNHEHLLCLEGRHLDETAQYEVPSGVSRMSWGAPVSLHGANITEFSLCPLRAQDLSLLLLSR